MREQALGGNSQAVRRYGLAVLSHLALIVAWYLFVKLGEVPKFVMPSPYDTIQALLVPNYRWLENILVTTTEIFGGYILAVVIGIWIALLFSWFRGLEMAAMPLLVSLNMIPKVALGPLIIVYGIRPNIMMAFAICFFRSCSHRAGATRGRAGFARSDAHAQGRAGRCSPDPTARAAYIFPA
jgi:NitT/TauT family transport system permease protein